MIHVSEHLRIRTRSQENLALYCVTFSDETGLLQPGIGAPSLADIAVPRSCTEEANPPNSMNIAKKHATCSTRVTGEEVEVKRDIWWIVSLAAAEKPRDRNTSYLAT